jgi:hypothetical protein
MIATTSIEVNFTILLALSRNLDGLDPVAV